ncbi:MAG: hypothetical protein GY710_05840 [Desulfobacteraceae bacterium]|nr:hypothetical protein [Desulfobacteraceae bacterium]
MEEKSLKSVYFHFRFKFLAVTSISFLLYVILSGSGEFSQFASSIQFKLIGPFFVFTGISFLIFRRFPIKCPGCSALVATKKDWECNYCLKSQGKERYLIDRCVHCRQVQTTASCELCKEEFLL